MSTEIRANALTANDAEDAGTEWRNRKKTQRCQEEIFRLASKRKTTKERREIALADHKSCILSRILRILRFELCFLDPLTGAVGVSVLAKGFTDFTDGNGC